MKQTQAQLLDSMSANLMLVRDVQKNNVHLRRQIRNS